MDTDQAAVSNAFAWVHAVYRESAALLVEATEQLDQKGFVAWAKAGSAGKETWYLLAQVFSTPKEINADSGQDIFIGVSFYPDARVHRGEGPRLLLGTQRRRRRDAKHAAKELNQATWVINVTARAPGESELFRIVSPPGNPHVACEPTDRGCLDLPWIERMESFELPLTSVRTRGDVADVVRAVIALREGNAAPAHELLARWPG